MYVYLELALFFVGTLSFYIPFGILESDFTFLAVLTLPEHSLMKREFARRVVAHVTTHIAVFVIQLEL